ncbi:profilin [Plasmodium falciparum Vietnam Oak-Knoll (FVO)]|uniref:Profilin n=1 Tax=Plasmodium falciparum Vietnam Oak-Knoll (FVO) TaxID=1036723 RepID=A0A024V8G2_PLAFA|nr:profilin [Plasmodium falciparum Vietnam Oak-Knoll (FVO)]
MTKNIYIYLSILKNCSYKISIRFKKKGSNYFKWNGTKTTKTINEGQTILVVFNEGYAPDGVWLGGTKYQFINIERDLEFEGYNFDVATCAKLKGGLHLVKVPGGNILVVLYDEEKEQDRDYNNYYYYDDEHHILIRV